MKFNLKYKVLLIDYSASKASDKFEFYHFIQLFTEIYQMERFRWNLIDN